VDVANCPVGGFVGAPIDRFVAEVGLTCACAIETLRFGWSWRLWNWVRVRLRFGSD
jgi:uncharacterized membrane protein